MRTSLIAASLSLFLGACSSTYDPYTGEEETSKSAIGAGIGASLGAVIAYLDNKDEDARKRNQRILAAAAGGAALGAGVGYYMDTQEAKLRKQLRGTGVSVKREGDNINLIMPGNITFATGSAEVKDQFKPILDSVTLVLEEFDKTLIVVGGHTDSDGSDTFNQQLSENRARSVAQYFAQKGILAERLDPVGFGERVPITSNQTMEGKQQNRRVELTLLPIVTN